MALFDPRHDAELLHKAAGKFKTDHAMLINVLAEKHRTNAQMQELRRVFTAEQKDDLVEVVKKATNLPHQSSYSDALVATLLTSEEFVARELKNAMKGLGTDERAMIQVLAHVTKPEVEQIKSVYHAMYKKSLQDDITSDTSGVEKEFFLGLINAPRSRVNMATAQPEIDQDVKELYLAGQARWSSDVSAFVTIITKHDNEYLAALNLAYGRAYGDTLVCAVEKEVSKNVVQKGMEAMILDRADFYASEINEAVSGAGTDTDTLTRIIATQRHTLPAICHTYMTKFGKDLFHHLNDESSINDSKYGKVLLSLLKVGSEGREADPAHTAAACAPRAHLPGYAPAPGYPPPMAGAPPSYQPMGHAPPHGYPMPEAPGGYPGGPTPPYSAPAPYGAPPGYPPAGAPYRAPPSPYGAPPSYGAPPASYSGYPPPAGYPPPPAGYPPSGYPASGYPPAPPTGYESQPPPGYPDTKGHGMTPFTTNPHFPAGAVAGALGAAGAGGLLAMAAGHALPGGHHGHGDGKHKKGKKDKHHKKGKRGSGSGSGSGSSSSSSSSSSDSD